MRFSHTHNPFFILQLSGCSGRDCRRKNCTRGVLFIIPWNKNKQHVSSWLSISDRDTLLLIVNFMCWRVTVEPPNPSIFPALRSAGRSTQHTYTPADGPSKEMSVNNVRDWLRQVLRHRSESYKWVRHSQHNNSVSRISEIEGSPSGTPSAVRRFDV